jgi:L-amino acid N-acyltransferase YncA
MEIRFAEEKDYTQMMEIDNEVWTEENMPMPIRKWESTAAYRDNLLDSGVTSIVAIEDEEILGVLHYYSISAAPATEHVREVSLMVKSSAQRQGIGQTLLETLKKNAVKKQIRKLRLRVLSTNIGAMNLYKKCGFEVEGVLKEEFFLNHQYVDDIFMAYFLSLEK